MRSRILSDAFEWLASQSSQSLVNSNKGVFRGFRMGGRQAAFIAGSQRSLYNESGIFSPLFSRSFSAEAIVDKKDAPKSGRGNNSQWDLFRKIVRYGTVDKTIKAWVEDGNEMKKSNFLLVIRKLRKASRFNQALKLSEWMQNQSVFEFKASDHALRIDLLCKVHSVGRAEQYFANLPENAKDIHTHGALLHCYVKNNLTKKAEQQMEKIEELGLATNEHLFNEIMTIYMATGQVDKVLLKIKHMKEMNVLPDKTTYNLWMSACEAKSDIDEVEKIMDEIKAGGENNVHWSTYITLAKIYIKAGLVDKAESAVKEAEKTYSPRENEAYDSLLILYGDLGNKVGVQRIWKSLKESFNRATKQNYVSVLVSLVKVGDIEGAEKLFEEWESLNSINDIKLSNILLDAYVNKGMLEKAETFLAHAVERKGIPNCWTREILTKGYIESKQMDKAVQNMNNALRKVSTGDWNPKSENIMCILKHFEEQGNIEGAEEYLKLLRRFKCLTTEVYSSLLSTYVKAGKAATNILEQMGNDNVSTDEETDRLLKLVNE